MFFCLFFCLFLCLFFSPFLILDSDFIHAIEREKYILLGTTLRRLVSESLELARSYICSVFPFFRADILEKVSDSNLNNNTDNIISERRCMSKGKQAHKRKLFIGSVICSRLK